jgi:glycosyltransferase involved in cell wall biosynthesis
MNAAIDILANKGTVGGGEVMMVAFAEAARAVGIPVRVVAPRRPAGAADLARAHGFEVLEIPAEDRRDYLENLALRRRNLDAELLWCNGLVPALATAASRHRRIVQLHQVPSGLQRRVWQIARRGVSQVFVPSRSMQAQVPDSDVLVNWTDDPGPPRPPEPSDSEALRIGFIGRFSPIKGLDVLARAVQRLDRFSDRPVRLVLAGDSRFVDDFGSGLIELELGRVAHVERLGWVERAAFFAAVDLVVVPSVWAEPFGLVAAEAMAFGRPVLVSDAGALVEVVGASHPWVVRAGDALDTARVIQRFLDTDPGEVQRVCTQARRRWETEFSPAAGRRRVFTVLEQLGML